VSKSVSKNGVSNWKRGEFHPYEEFARTVLERAEWEDPLDRQGPTKRKLMTNLETGSSNETSARFVILTAKSSWN
jgi:hypothetical protein